MSGLERKLALLTLISVVAMGIAGKQNNRPDLTPFYKQVLPEAKTFTQISEGVQAGKRGEGYVSSGMGAGYGGPMVLVVGYDPLGAILQISVASHNETLPFYQRVEARDVLGPVKGRSCSDRIRLDSVSGATFTVLGLEQALHQASLKTSKALNKPPPPKEKTPFKFGLLEISLCILFAASFFIKKPWILLAPGLVVVGFAYGAPLTLVNINSFLMGYWPHPNTNPAWYLMLAGVFLPILILGKNLYCAKICPFGALQEGVGLISNTKRELPSKVKWVQRVLALSAILVALWVSNPGIVSYEPFGAAFNFTGQTFVFVLLAVVVLGALFFKRPWCRALCPIKACADYVRRIRSVLRP